MKFLSKCIFPLLICSLIVSCKEKYTPKPYGFFRIEFPPKSYHLLEENLPYSFQIADNATIEPDKTYDAEPYWVNIVYKDCNAKINISYKQIIADTSLENYLADSHRLAYAHITKADAIQEKGFENRKKGIFGVLYQITGDAASPAQFFVTDSIHNFIRGSLYIHQIPAADSLAPVIEYLKKDIVVLMETIEFQ
ncbi:MAG: gliding motility lipoprotein GldD [Culturomica sp.]|jgi:gliding motility-associated lipoprotein GldD|nr:gliding motility lipoprotein GldD [Culturomica sp.]